MHPEILRELSAQRGRDLRAQAHEARLARLSRQARRAVRRGVSLPDEAGLVIPAIPDYVDGSFRTEPASALPASTGPASTGPASTGPADTGPAAGQVSGAAAAARHAA